MDRARSRKRLRARTHRLLALVAFVPLWLSARAAWAAEIAILPSTDGRLGAWLALGPASSPPKLSKPHEMGTTVVTGAEESSLTGRLGRTVALAPLDPDAEASTATWKIVSAAEGPIDLLSALGQRGPEAFAFLYGVLHLEAPLQGMLLLGASDGAKVWIDRRVVSANDWPRPERDDEDVIRLDLSAGDHPILLKLHHRDGYWASHVRIVDTMFAAPAGAYLRLPGTGDGDARSLAPKMTSIDVNRGLGASGFRPSVTVSFPEGLPRGTDRSVHVRASARAQTKSKDLFDLDAGQVPLGQSGPSELKVQLPKVLPDEIGDAENGGELVISVEIAGRKLDAPLQLRPFMRQTMSVVERALALVGAGNGFLADPTVTRATLEHLRDRFAHQVNVGDSDVEALAVDARTLADYAADLEARRDPLRSHAGIRRFAYRSPLDGELSPFGVYVPPSFLSTTAGSKTYPLVVVLHGMNGKPLSMVRWFFGHDDEGRDSEWEDRHPGEVDPLEGFVIAPNAFGNAMYRELGEVDVMKVLDWAERFFPIDKNRISITGVSMGGTGTGSIAFRYPDRFAAAEPLCGYHSYFVRRDISFRAMWPWEKLLAEQRSNSLWADNGLYLPLYVWHGKKDFPEKNSGVLIERYKALGYAIEHEHPDVGHDVWKRAYEAGQGFHWLAQKTRPLHKRHIVFKTDSPRYVDDAWLHLMEISPGLEFASVDAKIVEAGLVEMTTQGVEAFALDRDPELVPTTTPTRVRIDGTALVFEPSVPVAAYKSSGTWRAGTKPTVAGAKRAGLSGPIRDVFFEPLVFVYGTLDAAQTRANRETVRAWAKIRWGVDARYPVIADTEVDDKLAETHSLVLVGNSESNRVVRDLESDLPFKATSSGIVATSEGGAIKEWKGNDLGVAFVYPNPKHRGRYVLVVEGTSALGTFRSIALPELLPDFIVFDDKIAASRGQIILGAATPLAAGLFRQDWSLNKADLNTLTRTPR
jgi:predicted esterase